MLAANHEFRNSDYRELIAAKIDLIDKCLSDGSAEFCDPHLRYISRLKRVASDEGKDFVVIATFIGIQDLKLGAQIWNADDIHQRKLLDLSEMAAGVAHEINNPLSVIMAKIYHLRIHITRGEVDKGLLSATIDKIEAHSTRIFKIVKSMRTFSRDARTDNMVEIPLHAIIDSAFDILNRRIRDSGVNVDVSGVDENFKIVCRETELLQVFTNLLENALDAIKTLHFPAIKVEVSELETQYEIAIFDNGPGVLPESEAKIFTPFFTTKPPGSGTGIGLSISLRIIGDHKGSLVLDRTRGPSCFVIRLPKPKKVDARYKLDEEKIHGT